MGREKDGRGQWKKWKRRGKEEWERGRGRVKKGCEGKGKTGMDEGRGMDCCAPQAAAPRSASILTAVTCTYEYIRISSESEYGRSARRRYRLPIDKTRLMVSCDATLCLKAARLHAGNNYTLRWMAASLDNSTTNRVSIRLFLPYEPLLSFLSICNALGFASSCFTSAKEVMFSPVSVCQSVCLFAY